MAASAAAVAVNADSKCSRLIESLTEKYDIVINKETEVVQGLFRYELFDITTLAALYEAPVDVFDNIIHIRIFQKDSDHSNYLALIQLKRETKGNRPVFDLGLIISRQKGLGRQLLYLAACLAHRHQLQITFFAVPASDTKVGRNQEKLFEYYNSIGFTRNGELKTNPDTGSKTQRYLSRPNNVLLHFDPSHLGGRRTRRSRRTQRHKKQSRKTRIR